MIVKLNIITGLLCVLSDSIILGAEGKGTSDLGDELEVVIQCPRTANSGSVTLMPDSERFSSEWQVRQVLGIPREKLRYLSGGSVAPRVAPEGADLAEAIILLAQATDEATRASEQRRLEDARYRAAVNAERVTHLAKLRDERASDRRTNCLREVMNGAVAIAGLGLSLYAVITQHDKKD